MSCQINHLILNPGSIVSPLKLNGWLRDQLQAQSFKARSKIHVFLFLPQSVIGALGRPAMDRILRKAARVSWVAKVEVIGSPAPFTDDEAKLHVSRVYSQRAGTQLDGLETTFFGYASELEANRFLDDQDVEPLCLIRRITARDIERIDIDHQGLMEGEWVVISLADENLELSHSMASFDDAATFAKSAFSALNFVAMPLQRGLE